ncbi:MAG: archease [Polyangiaceae bacterium]|jgi:SHS2 domain-containing protein|nr:archease [Polyangiaceae bacterium]
MSYDSGHCALDHTADIALEAWAPSEPAVLLELARALMQVLTEGKPIDAAASRDLSVDALDPEDRVVRWINELCFLATSEGFLLADADIRLRQDGLDATLRGARDAWDLIATEVKSATYYDLRLARDEFGRYVARVVIDV